MRNDLILIASADDAWGIGNENALLQPVPEDLKRFSQLTRGNAVVCGRKTLETFKDGKPLPNRVNIILTRSVAISRSAESSGSMSSTPEEILVVHDLEALSRVLDTMHCSIYVIGGASVYRQLLDYCATALITRLDGCWEADSFLPDLDADPQWTLADEEEWQTSRNGVRFRYCRYERV